MDDQNKKTLQNRSSAVLTEASWKFILFLPNCEVFATIQITCSPVKCQILDEETTSNCSNECIKSTSTQEEFANPDSDQLLWPVLVCGATKAEKNHQINLIDLKVSVSSNS